ncbi:hypothetical protein WJ94_15870 [Burkholderia ubonensis]|uniref:hypothetical protein n=1 Tax=Burkholderia ubonensis TaxID=101571 RepID=UPI00075496C4|nr:hypothetical protein [Burkholderia ubonensis]KVP76889.1 hypothetical protein WJ94_15870 [Burkholderia ubonensis]
MDDFYRLQTSAEVYAVIMAKHRDQMRCYASFSDPDGTFNGGPGERGRMDTIWSIDGCAFPILEINTTWNIDPAQPFKRLNLRSVHFLCLPKKES